MSQQPSGDPVQGGEPNNGIPENSALNNNNFTDDEIQNLRSIFEMFDPNRTGSIEVKDLETIMGSLQRDANEVREFVDKLSPNSNGKVSFEEFHHMIEAAGALPR